MNVSRTSTKIMPNDLERKMIYDTYDLLLAGKSEADLIDYINNYEDNHIGQAVKRIVKLNISKHFANKNPPHRVEPIARDEKNYSEPIIS